MGLMVQFLFVRYDLIDSRRVAKPTGFENRLKFNPLIACGIYQSKFVFYIIAVKVASIFYFVPNSEAYYRGVIRDNSSHKSWRILIRVIYSVAFSNIKKILPVLCYLYTI